MTDDIENEILAVIRKYALSKSVSLDVMLGRELGIRGGDSVEFLDELEGRFNVDLRPLVERGPLEQNTLMHRFFGIEPRCSGVDFTGRELVEFIRDRVELG